jgi:hypothetical protein
VLFARYSLDTEVVPALRAALQVGYLARDNRCADVVEGSDADCLKPLHDESFRHGARRLPGVGCPTHDAPSFQRSPPPRVNH